MSNALSLQRSCVDTFSVKATLQVPQLLLKGGYFYCDGHVLYLRSSRNKCLLIQEFLHAPDHSLHLTAIIRAVYGLTRSLSPRFQDSLRKSAHRMLADTRALLHDRYVRYRHLEWLPYSYIDNSWYLYRFADEYVLDRIFG